MTNQQSNSSSNSNSSSSSSSNSSTCPFVDATSIDKRIKLLLWGETEAGKTTIALQFPNPVIIDLDGGSTLYQDKFKFRVCKAQSLGQVKKAVVWLVNNPDHGFETIIIDPITLYYHWTVKYWNDIFLMRCSGNQNKTEYFDLGPRERAIIRNDFQRLFTYLDQLNMHVVCTGRAMPNLKRIGNNYTTIGDKADTATDTDFSMDVVIYLKAYETGEHVGLCTKDRSEVLPRGDEFPISYEILAGKWGLPVNPDNQPVRQPVTAPATTGQKTPVQPPVPTLEPMPISEILQQPELAPAPAQKSKKTDESQETGGKEKSCQP